MPRTPGFDRWTGLKHAKRGRFRPNHHLFMAVLLGFRLQKVHFTRLEVGLQAYDKAIVDCEEALRISKTPLALAIRGEVPL